MGKTRHVRGGEVSVKVVRTTDPSSNWETHTGNISKGLQIWQDREENSEAGIHLRWAVRELPPALGEGGRDQARENVTEKQGDLSIKETFFNEGTCTTTMMIRGRLTAFIRLEIPGWFEGGHSHSRYIRGGGEGGGSRIRKKGRRVVRYPSVE